MSSQGLLILTLHPFNLKEGWRSYREDLSIDDFKPSLDLKLAKKVVYKYPNGDSLVLRDDLRKRT